jgi:MerR family copper efflux transcriptional regulator
MLIAEFCRRADLTRDAVRLYVKLGLFTPNVGHSASNRYQQFNDADLDRAAVIRTAQQLGFTLKQIVTFNREYAAGAMDVGRKLDIMRGQLQAVDVQAERIRAMRKYLRAKIAWLEGGEKGVEPVFCRSRP